MAFDNFTGTNGTPLDAHDAKWSLTGAVSIEIQANRAQLTTAGDSARYVDSQPQIQSSEVVWAPGTFSDGARRVFINSTSSWADGYAIKVDDTNFTLTKDGSWLGYLDQAHGLSGIDAAGITVKIAQLSAGIIKLYLNGSEVGSYTDGTPVTDGNPGFAITKGAGAASAYTAEGWSDGVTAPAPTITGTPAPVDGTDFNIAGTNLGSASSVTLGGKAVTIVSNTAVLIVGNIAVDQGSGADLKLLTDYPLVVTTSGGSDSVDVQVSPAANHLAVTIATPNQTSAYRFQGLPDLASGGQIDSRAWSCPLGNVTLNDDGTVTFSAGTSFPVTCEARYCDPTGPTWDGWVAQTFSLSGDTIPNAFVFNDVNNVALSAVQTSNQITVAGIDTASPISVVGGEYSKNGGTFTNVAGTVVAGDTVRVRHTSSALNSTATNTTLTIGGVSDTYTSTTIPVGGQPGGVWSSNVGEWRVDVAGDPAADGVLTVNPATVRTRAEIHILIGMLRQAIIASRWPLPGAVAVFGYSRGDERADQDGNALADVVFTIDLTTVETRQQALLMLENIRISILASDYPRS